MTSGTRAANPSIPTQNDECVMLNICTGTATAVSWNPT